MGSLKPRETWKGGITSFLDVTAVDPQTAWAVGIDWTVIRTVNGGSSWQEVQTRTSRTQLFGVTVKDKNKV